MRIDDKRLQKFKKQLQQIGKIKIQIGAVGEHRPKRKGGKTISNAFLFAIHEFGLGNNPARAPIQITMSNDANLQLIQETIINLMRANFKDIQVGFDVDTIAEGIVLRLKQLIRVTISSRLSPANTPETLKQKRGDLPLVDTRQFINSIEGGYFFS